MDRIKFKTDEDKSYIIEKTLFEKKTQKQAPFYQKSERQNHETCQFAICPECNNPVQIIGLYKKLEHTDKPYARHYEIPIGLGKYNKENYEYCPYKANRKPFTKDSRKGEIDEIAQDIIRKMIYYFDKIVYLLQKKIGIYISTTLAKDMLNDFFDARAYLYRGASLKNVPLLLPYFSSNKTIIGRFVLDETLISALKQIPELDIKNNKIKSNKYIKLGFYFFDHKTKIEDHHLTESLIFSISKGEINEAKTIYQKKIVFDNLHFEKLINYKEYKLSEKQILKNKELLNIAKEVAKEHGFFY